MVVHTARIPPSIDMLATYVRDQRPITLQSTHAALVKQLVPLVKRWAALMPLQPVDHTVRVYHKTVHEFFVDLSAATNLVGSTNVRCIDNLRGCLLVH